jgi:error-prone DNA polymerase
VFVTLEDETGNVKVVIWPSLVEQQRKEVMGASLLGVYGIWQYQNNVHNLVAKRLVDLPHLVGKLGTRNGNFH